MEAKRHLGRLMSTLLFAGLAVIFYWTSTSSMAWGVLLTQTECKRCHSNYESDIISIHHNVRDANNWSCTKCHIPVPDGWGGYTIAPPNDCQVCHSLGHHTEPAGTNPARHHNLMINNDYGCLHCHPAVTDAAGDITIVLSRDCFFCHKDGEKPWREVKWLTDLPTTTSPDTTAKITDVTSKFQDTLTSEAFELADTSLLDKALSIRLNKDASTTSKVTLSFFQSASPQGTIRIYPYQKDGITVNTSVSKDFNFDKVGWLECDVTALANAMSNFSWMKFRVVVPGGQLFLSESSFIILRSTATPVANQPPIANAGPDQEGYINTRLWFSGNGSYDPDGTVSSYVWNFGDGSPTVNSTSTAAVPHTYTKAGSFLVSLAVTDNLGAVTEDFAIVNVKDSLPPNQPPVAIAGPDIAATVGQSVGLVGSSSSDPDGQITGYTWNFSDGTADSGAVVFKTFTKAGTYVATLTVVDDKMMIATDTVVITVTENLPPVANAGPDVKATVGEAINFNAIGAAEFAGISWDFGDETFDTAASVTKSYSAAGTYTVTLYVTNSVTGVRATDTAIVTVTAPVPVNLPPIANAGPDVTANTGKTINFTCTGSSDPDGTIVSYIWAFGDGSTKSGCNVSKAYSSAGQYNVTLTVKDNAGATATDTAIAKIAAPVRVRK